MMTTAQRLDNLEVEQFNTNNVVDDLNNKQLDVIHRVRVVERALADLGRIQAQASSMATCQLTQPELSESHLLAAGPRRAWCPAW